MFPDFDSNNPVTGAIANADMAARRDTGVIVRREKSGSVAEDKGQSEKAEKSRVTSTRTKKQEADTATLTFSLSPDERDTFGAIINGEDELDDREKKTLQSAAERITKVIDETIARNKEDAARVNKAVEEWYNRLSGGEGRSVGEFIRILHEASKGDFSSFD